MSEWSLERLLSSLHEDVERRLSIARSSFGHPGTKGDVSEGVWLELLRMYLPTRYHVACAHVVDSNGKFSQQLDVVVFDRQYSPFIFNFGGKTIIPAESVYAVFEAKQSLTLAQVKYASEKIASVRSLYRTSLPIPHAAGIHDAKALTHIIGGILTFESDWSPGLDASCISALNACNGDGKLDIGCVAAHGTFELNEAGTVLIQDGNQAATRFLLELMARLQSLATVPMIDIRAYAKWLAKPQSSQQ